MKLSVVKRRLPELAGQNLALIAAGLLLGLLLAVHWKDMGATPSTDAAGARERAAQAIQQLEGEQEQLKATLAQLRQQLNDVQHQAAQNTDLLTGMSAQLEQERMAAGLVALRGPGALVELDDSTITVPAPGTDPDSYVIHEYDLRDVVSLLWAGGAEAVAINDERLVNTTAIYCVGSTIMVNDTRLSPPYRIRAIGDRLQLAPSLEDPLYLTNLRERAKAYGVQLKISWPNQVDIPAYSGTFRVRYAHAGEVTP